MKKKKNVYTKKSIKIFHNKNAYKRKNIKLGCKKIKSWLLGSFVVPRMAVIVGFIFAFLFFIIPQILQKPPQPQKIIPTIDPVIPLNIEIPRLNLNLPIKEATVSANDWQVYADSVSWLKGSGNLEMGNLVLYGHNTKVMLGPIIQLGIGDQIILKGSSGEKIYVVEKSYQSTRWDLTAINAKQDQLTIYTCSGWFDANRWFVIAKPLNSSL